MNKELEIKTRKCYREIKASLDPKGYVADTLFAREIITVDQHRDIDRGPDPSTRAADLLFHLFKTAHPQAFVVFREALEKEYNWIIKMIDECTGVIIYSLLNIISNMFCIVIYFGHAL